MLVGRTLHGLDVTFGTGKRIELGLERELLGRVAKLKLQYFGHITRGKCRTVGTYSPRRNHGRVTASRQTKKTVDTRH